MGRSNHVKFPHSIQLFKFCQKVLALNTGSKINDQEVGGILDYNPSDCSHWKRGEKNVRSVFALEKLSKTLKVEATLLHDIATGNINLDEAYYEHIESKSIQENYDKVTHAFADVVDIIRQRIENFANTLLKQADFSTPPLYLPEVLRFFAFIDAQPVDMVDKLSRILRVRSGQYVLQYKKGELKPQTRLSMVRDIAKIIFQAERLRFPELGELRKELVEFEENMFAASLLVPKALLTQELGRLDSRRNMVGEAAALFWVPKSLIGYQMKDFLRIGSLATNYATWNTKTATITGSQI